MIQELRPSCAPHTDSVLEMRHPPKHMIHTDQLSEALDTVKTSSFTTINTRDASPTVLRSSFLARDPIDLVNAAAGLWWVARPVEDVPSGRVNEARNLTLRRYLVFKFCALVAQVVFYAGEAPAVIMPAEKLDD
ncbi:hypothetical protein FCOIX_3479 [Fusarium coicis]|nr:hypothetical protein FCOIX_3479 [Fusarium coicis]